MLPRTFKTMLNRSGESRCPGLFLVLGRMHWHLLQVFAYILLIRLKKFPCIPVSYLVSPERVLKYVTCFCCLYWNDHIVFLLYSISSVNFIDPFLVVKSILHSQDKYQLSILYIVGFNLVILLRIFMSMFMRNWPEVFLWSLCLGLESR